MSLRHLTLREPVKFENLSSWKIAKNFISYYRNAPDDEILFVLNDKPLCAYAGLHQIICQPYALREAKKRGLIHDKN